MKSSRKAKYSSIYRTSCIQEQSATTSRTNNLYEAILKSHAVNRTCTCSPELAESGTYHPLPLLPYILNFGLTHQSNSIQSALRTFPLPRNPNLYPNILPPSNADSFTQEMNAAENGIVKPLSLVHTHFDRARLSSLVSLPLIIESIDAAHKSALYLFRLCSRILLLT